METGYNLGMEKDINAPVIVAFVADVMFASRIEPAAESLGFQVEWVESADQIAPADEASRPARPQVAEHIYGPTAALFEWLTGLQPALLIFDLNNARIPWREWISILSASPATRRIPVLCYGSHVEADAIQAARAAGAREVVARSRFTSALPELILKHARQVDRSALEQACQGRLSELARRGLEEFNRGEFFEAHESLEHAWMAEEGPARELYRGILQVAVAYLQIQRKNYNGAAKMFLRLRQWLDPLPDNCRGVDVGRLRADVRSAHEHLLALGPEGIQNFEQEYITRVVYS
jgi:uncharacterized protein